MKYNFFYSEEPKEYKAIAEIYSNIHNENMNAVMLFITENYNLDMISAGIKKMFEGIQVFACTSEYLIYESNIKNKGILAISLNVDFTETEIIYLNKAEEVSVSKVELLSISYKTKNPDFYKHPGKYVGVFFNNGNNEINNGICSLLSAYFNPINILGISPSSKSYSPNIYNGTDFSESYSALVLFKIKNPFATYNFNNFLPSNTPLVVTECDIDKRKVYELNTENAAIKYSDLIGIDIDKIDDNLYADYPLIIKNGKMHEIKVIKRINKSDLSIEFFEPIELGTIFRIGERINTCENTQNNFDEIKKSFGDHEFILTFDSIFRIKSAIYNHLIDEYISLLNNFRCIGIASQSEILQGKNSNITSTGIVFLK